MRPGTLMHGDFEDKPMTGTRIGLALLFCPLLWVACSGPQQIATAPASGITASIGGGQRSLGDIPNVGVTNGA